ncbi:Cof-type HAD-IIB family hydrolase [Paenibacillus sp. LHD-117]|uniref:Cof-type HAD-IIB family hydrolase n=1 Tax=Paenibacillus sp. LHD-117 TaxID=3071412 RepID=UPI0027DF3595|nr:Cof-type HAD-IIB family hydrolase [Paenibacillus sp. LHD-117]MDQ6423313.1 Cof-type HAD-IIB family hydrolase [Paenibacillus sp. LHD-117]
MKLNYDLIALDVDGTLLTDDHLLPVEVKEAVRECARMGAEIVLCTGRGPIGAFPVLEELGLNGTLITHNGAATVEFEDRSILFQFDIAKDLVEPYMTYCRARGIHFDLNTAYEMMVESVTESAAEMYGLHKATPELRVFDQGLPDGLVKLSVFGTKEEIDAVQADWENEPLDLQLIRSGDLFIDIQHPEASKGGALRRLAEQRAVPRERILAIGNYFNDISMLEFAGLGIAMGNSPEGVKEKADLVIGTNNEGSVAEALRAYACNG